MKSYDELTFTDDFMFCKVMQDEKISRGVLELLLGIKIRKIDYIQKQKTIDESYLGKGIRMDVYIEGDDRIYDVEMQTTIRPDLGLRTRYYQSLIDIENLEKGQEYSELRQSIIIFICLDDPFDKGLPVYSFKTTCQEDGTVDLNDKAEKYFYNSSRYRDCSNRYVRSFLEFLAEGKTSDTDLIKRIKAAVEKAKQNEIWRHEYMVWNLAYTDAKYAARKEGLEEGLAEGRAEGRSEGLTEGRAQGLTEGAEKKAAEVALNSIKLGIAPETVVQITSLPLEKVLELQKQVQSEK